MDKDNTSMDNCNTNVDSDNKLDSSLLNDLSVLILGGGTSLLAEELAADLLLKSRSGSSSGLRPRVTCMDYSPAAVATMKRRTANSELVPPEVAECLKYDCADMFSLVSTDDDDCDDVDCGNRSVLHPRDGAN